MGCEFISRRRPPAPAVGACARSTSDPSCRRLLPILLLVLVWAASDGKATFWPFASGLPRSWPADPCDAGARCEYRSRRRQSGSLRPEKACRKTPGVETSWRPPQTTIISTSPLCGPLLYERPHFSPCPGVLVLHFPRFTKAALVDGPVLGRHLISNSLFAESFQDPPISDQFPKRFFFTSAFCIVLPSIFHSQSSI